MTSAAPKLMATITLWASLLQTSGTSRVVAWDELFAEWSTPRPFLGQNEHPGWSAGVFDPCRRANDHVRELHALVLDYDGGSSIDEALATWTGSYGFLHTTRKSTAESPRFRVVLPLTRAVTPAEYALVWAWAWAQAGQLVDKGPKDAARFWFQPGSDHYETRLLEGALLDVDAILRPRATPLSAPVARATGYARAALTKAVAALLVAPRGSRNLLLSKEAFGLGGFVASGELDYQEVSDALLDATSGWDAAEERRTRATLRGQLEAGMRRPRTVPEPRSAPVLSQSVLPGPRDPGTVPGDIGDSLPDAPAVATPATGIRGERGSELAERPPPMRWVCRGLHLAPGRPLLLSAFGGSGKTWLAMDLALAIATGRATALGMLPVQVHGRVVHLNFEMSRHEIRRRYQRLAHAARADIAASSLEVVSRPHLRGADLSSSGFKEQLVALCTDAVLCVIDSLRAGVGALDENSSEARGPLDMLLEVSDLTGCAFVVIHHEKKPGAEAVDPIFRIRGSGAIPDACDATWHVVPQEHAMRVEQGKVSMGQREAPLHVRLVDVGSIDPDTDKSIGIYVEWMPPEQLEALASVPLPSTVRAREAILAALRTGVRLTARQITHGPEVRGNKTARKEALTQLVDEGLISSEKGKNGGRVFYVQT